MQDSDIPTDADIITESLFREFCRFLEILEFLSFKKHSKKSKRLEKNNYCPVSYYLTF